MATSATARRPASGAPMRSSIPRSRSPTGWACPSPCTAPPNASLPPYHADMKRRDFLQLLGSVPLAASVPSLAGTPDANRLLVLVYLYGGNDGYNTWVPYHTPLYYKLRP